jgi:hypothetical protein
VATFVLGILWAFKATWVKGNVLGKPETKSQTRLDSDDDSMSPPWWKGDF